MIKMCIILSVQQNAVRIFGHKYLFIRIKAPASMRLRSTRSGGILSEDRILVLAYRHYFQGE